MKKVTLVLYVFLVLTLVVGCTAEDDLKVDLESIWEGFRELARFVLIGPQMGIREEFVWQIVFISMTLAIIGLVIEVVTSANNTVRSGRLTGTLGIRWGLPLFFLGIWATFSVKFVEASYSIYRYLPSEFSIGGLGTVGFLGLLISPLPIALTILVLLVRLTMFGVGIANLVLAPFAAIVGAHKSITMGLSAFLAAIFSWAVYIFTPFFLYTAFVGIQMPLIPEILTGVTTRAMLALVFQTIALAVMLTMFWIILKLFATVADVVRSSVRFVALTQGSTPTGGYGAGYVQGSPQSVRPGELDPETHEQGLLGDVGERLQGVAGEAIDGLVDRYRAPSGASRYSEEEPTTDTEATGRGSDTGRSKDPSDRSSVSRAPEKQEDDTADTSYTPPESASDLEQRDSKEGDDPDLDVPAARAPSGALDTQEGDLEETRVPEGEEPEDDEDNEDEGARSEDPMSRPNSSPPGGAQMLDESGKSSPSSGALDTQEEDDLEKTKVSEGEEPEDDEDNQDKSVKDLDEVNSSPPSGALGLKEEESRGTSSAGVRSSGSGGKKESVPPEDPDRSTSTPNGANG